MIMSNAGETTFFSKPRKPGSGRPKGSKQRKEKLPKWTVYFDNRGTLDKVGDYTTFQAIADDLNVSQASVFKLFHGLTKRPWKLARYSIVSFVEGGKSLKNFLLDQDDETS